MSKPQTKKRSQLKLARLQIVSKMYLRGHSFRQIRDEVMKRLDIATYSMSTVHKDVNSLLKEWQENRLDNTDDAARLELERIDETVRELWEQWEKSKEDYIRTTNTRRGAPSKKKKSEGSIETYGVAETKTNCVGLGNPAYIAEIRYQLMERRKLLGLYPAEKKNITGDLSFSSFLVESGMLEAAESGISKTPE